MDRSETSLRTPLCDLLGCRVPILLAGMGGVSHWELAAAVAKAGGYPMLGMVREDLSPIEVANAVAVLVEDFGQSHQDVATHLGRSRPAVSNLLRLLELPEIGRAHV